MNVVRLTMHIEVPYPSDQKFLSMRVARVLREIADFSEHSALSYAGGNPPNTTKVLQSGAFSWEREI